MKNVQVYRTYGNLWKVTQFMGHISVMMTILRQIGEVGVRIHHLCCLVDPGPGEQGGDLGGLLQGHDVLLVIGGGYHRSLALAGSVVTRRGARSYNEEFRN